MNIHVEKILDLVADHTENTGSPPRNLKMHKSDYHEILDSWEECLESRKGLSKSLPPNLMGLAVWFYEDWEKSEFLSYEVW